MDVQQGAKSTAQPPGKRNRPCDACRRRKNKCVTEEGNTVCVLCKLHGQQCKYEKEPQPRKRTSAAPGNAVSAAAGNKRTKTLHLKPGTGVEEYDTLPGPSLLKRTLGLQNRHHTEYVGPHAIPDVYGPHPIPGDALQPEEPNKRLLGDSVRFVHPTQAFRIIPDCDTAGYEREARAIDDIEATAQGNGLELVQLYFRIVHPSFPVLHKDVFLEKYRRSYREFSPPLLAAVYLLASGYWTYSDSLASAKRIDTERLKALAFESLQETLKRPKISTLQAGLLLSQYQKAFCGSEAVEQQDRLTVQLVNLAHGLGIHLDCSSWDIPEWEISLRRRVGWGLFMQDKWTALLEGRPSLISHEDWEVENLSEIDFPENTEDEQEGSSEVERSRLVFMHMAQLSVILSHILRSLFSARARRALDQSPNPLGTLLDAIKPSQLQLKDWHSFLPESLKMDTAASMKLSSVGYLRLAYLAVEICLHRHLLRTMTSQSNTDPNIARICLVAARERFVNATDFVSRLQAQHLPSFWYFGSAKCLALVYSIGRVLEFSEWVEEEKAFYTRKLKEFRWAVKVNGEAGAFFMSQALALINRPVRLASTSGDSESVTTSPASMLGVSNGGSQPPMSAPPASAADSWSPSEPQAFYSDGTDPNFGIPQHHNHQQHHPGVNDPTNFFANFSGHGAGPIPQQMYSQHLLDDATLAAVAAEPYQHPHQHPMQPTPQQISQQHPQLLPHQSHLYHDYGR